ncbi:MAG: hypothetical protein AB3N11_13870, partial [Arenibacterium sp.]
PPTHFKHGDIENKGPPQSPIKKVPEKKKLRPERGPSSPQTPDHILAVFPVPLWWDQIEKGFTVGIAPTNHKAQNNRHYTNRL